VKFLLIGLIGLTPALLPAQTSGTCASPFQSAVTAGTDLSMTLRSGDITIAGGDGPVLRVTCSVRDRQSPSDVKISFAANHLTVRGGDHDGITFRVEVPRSMHLRIRCTAGNLTISGIAGNKDIDLNAGNLNIVLGDAGQYRNVEASVLAGDLTAPAFGSNHDGLFRRFRHENAKGTFNLRAAILAGNLTLR
jgi:hypothetical protein